MLESKYGSTSGIEVAGEGAMSPLTGLTAVSFFTAEQVEWVLPVVLESGGADLLSDTSYAGRLLPDAVIEKTLLVASDAGLSQIILLGRRSSDIYRPWHSVNTTSLEIVAAFIGDSLLSNFDIAVNTTQLQASLEKEWDAEGLQIAGMVTLRVAVALVTETVGPGQDMAYNVGAEFTGFYTAIETTDTNLFFGNLSTWEVMSISTVLAGDDVGLFKEMPISVCNASYNQETGLYSELAMSVCDGAMQEGTVGSLLSGGMVGGHITLVSESTHSVGALTGGSNSASVSLAELFELARGTPLFNDADQPNVVLRPEFAGSCSVRTAGSEVRYLVPWYVIVIVLSVVTVLSVLVHVGTVRVASICWASPWDVVSSQLGNDGNCTAKEKYRENSVTPYSQGGHTTVVVNGQSLQGGRWPAMLSTRLVAAARTVRWVVDNEGDRGEPAIPIYDTSHGTRAALPGTVFSTEDLPPRPLRADSCGQKEVETRLKMAAEKLRGINDVVLKSRNWPKIVRYTNRAERARLGLSKKTDTTTQRKGQRPLTGEVFHYEGSGCRRGLKKTTRYTITVRRYNPSFTSISRACNKSMHSDGEEAAGPPHPGCIR